MASHIIWSLFFIPALVAFTLRSLRKGIKWKRGTKSRNLSRVIWLGRGNGVFADARSKFWTFIRGRQLFAEAYFKVRPKPLSADCVQRADVSAC